MRRAVAIGLTGLLVHAAPAAHAEAAWLVPPVDAPVSRWYEPPGSLYGRGHRGVDYDVPRGTPVRAAGAGEVTFAGRVADRNAVTITHPDGLETTYTFLDNIYVARGERVTQGTWIGTSGPGHPGAHEGLHFGVRRDGHYLDPMDHLGPVDASSALRLVPETGELPASHEQACREAPRIATAGAAPNRNVAVTVAGIGSSTDRGGDAEIFRHGPELLGYPDQRVYRFSYRGAENERLHEPYAKTDTYGDLRQAAARLRRLLARISERHPGASVDLIAHSQGGVVARTLLSSIADRWDARLPRIAHLVTFASPHKGAPLAGAARDIGEDSLTGPLLLAGASSWARRGGPLPDPSSTAVEQLAPGSELLERLLSEDVAFGTRTLTLAMPHDAIVPANRAGIPHTTSHVLPPEGIDGHSAIVRSPAARGIVYDFLRGAAPACPGWWDRLGPAVGRALSFAEGRIPRLYEAAEDALGGRHVKVGRLVVRGGRRLGRLILGPRP
jgi:hypothetical protein